MNQPHQKNPSFHKGIIGTAVLCLTLLLISCSSTTDYYMDDSLENIKLEELLASPEELTINNVELNVSTYLWRDFMPISPSDGKPLNANVTIESKDGEQLPENLDTDAIWVIHGDEVWGTSYSDEKFENDPTKISKIARNGPKFGPDVSVTVVTRILHGDSTYLLRITGQEIYKTM